MSNFTDAQLVELETIFGLKRQESLPVRDGRVTRDSMVWWRSVDGPERIKAGDAAHWVNIYHCPDVYQVAEPVYRIVYSD